MLGLSIAWILLNSFCPCADTYEKARQLAKIAEETSNLESADDISTKRRHKAPIQHSDDSDDGDGKYFIAFPSNNCCSWLWSNLMNAGLSQNIKQQASYVAEYFICWCKCVELDITDLAQDITWWLLPVLSNVITTPIVHKVLSL